MKRWLWLGLAVPVVLAVGVAYAWSPLQNGPWRDGSTHGRWRTVFTGYGQVKGDGQYVQLEPRAVGNAGQTHAALVVSNDSYRDLTLSASIRTEQQLRTDGPNAWEVGWLLWHYSSPQQFYALTLKPNGWEVSKQDSAYPHGQRFLASGRSPTFPVGSWHDVGVVQLGNVIKVSADGHLLASVTDTNDPYLSGATGLYSEDARVRFQNVQVMPISAHPEEIHPS